MHERPQSLPSQESIPQEASVPRETSVTAEAFEEPPVRPEETPEGSVESFASPDQGEPAGPSPAELQRRETTAEMAGTILTEAITPQSGFFEQSQDPFSQALQEVLKTGIGRVQEGLRSPDPAKRAKATNFMRGVNKDIANNLSAEVGGATLELPPAEELNQYAFAPVEVKTLMGALQEEPRESEEAKEGTRAVTEKEEVESLTPEETIVAKEVARYADAVAEKAEEKGVLVRGDHIFGMATEATFGDYFSTKEDEVLSGLSEEERRKIVADAFGKLRERTYRRLGIKKKKAPAKKDIPSPYGLAA